MVSNTKESQSPKFLTWTRLPRDNIDTTPFQDRNILTGEISSKAAKQKKHLCHRGGKLMAAKIELQLREHVT